MRCSPSPLATAHCVQHQWLLEAQVTAREAKLSALEKKYTALLLETIDLLGGLSDGSDV